MVTLTILTMSRGAHSLEIKNHCIWLFLDTFVCSLLWVSCSSRLCFSFQWMLRVKFIHDYSQNSFPCCPRVQRHPPLPVRNLPRRLLKLALRPSEQCTFCSYCWWRIVGVMAYTLQSRVILFLSLPRCAGAGAQCFDVKNA